jgi:hypothetical protein
MTEDTWLEVRRFQVPVEAEMAQAFLEDHGVRVLLRGPSSTTHSLMRFAGNAEVRLLVAAADLEDAREALAALAPETLELPFRGAVPRDLATSPDADARERGRGLERSAARVAVTGPRPRSVIAVMVASSVLPIAVAHLSQGCRADEDVVVRRRPAPDFALAPSERDVALPPSFAGKPSFGPTPPR